MVLEQQVHHLVDDDTSGLVERARLPARWRVVESPMAVNAGSCRAGPVHRNQAENGVRAVRPELARSKANVREIGHRR